MTVDNQSASGAPENVSDVNQTVDELKLAENEGVESRNRLLKQFKDTKAENDLLRSELNQFKTEKQKQEEALLTKKGEFEKLNQIRQQEIDRLKAEKEEVEKMKSESDNALKDTWKLQAFYDKLPGKIKKREFLQFVDLNEIVFDSETGSVDPQSVDLAVNGFMENYSDLVDTSHVGRLPADHAKNGKLTGVDFKNMPLKEMRKNLPDAVKAARLKLGI
jgi:Skp family chaperone for outer membrane proteins